MSRGRNAAGRTGDGTADPVRPAGVRVIAPARLHLGLIDMNGSLGRRFGSIGLAVDAPRLAVRVERSAVPSASGPEAERAGRYLREAAALLGVDADVAVTVEEAMPAHAGFGSGTQLALALTAALGRLHGREADPRGLGSQLERGARSGIGIAAFTEGGFLVDGGRGTDGRPPPLVARLPFPEDWRLVLMLDEGMAGVHGSAEVEAFRTLPAQADAEAGALCRLVLMRLLPGIADADLAAVGSALTEIQARVGDHFAPAQGGRRFASLAVSTALEAALDAGAAGVGQSSWGPTGFALVGSAGAAESLTEALVRNCHTAGRLRFLTVKGRNRGASIETYDG